MIKIDISMPKSCWGCMFSKNDRCLFTKDLTDDPYYSDKRQYNCPLIPVPADKRGKWTFIERRVPQFDLCGTKTWAVAYRCSECGFIHTVIEDFGHYVFCPNCGAKMDVPDIVVGKTDEAEE